MYIKVSLLNGVKEPLYYTSPEEWGLLQIGTLVLVPLRNKKEYGYVIEATPEKPTVSFSIKPAFSMVDFPSDEHYFGFLSHLSSYHQLSPFSLLQRVKYFLSTEKHDEIETAQIFHNEELASQVTLTDEQTAVVSYITPFIKTPEYKPTLVHGVTGSGKTEIYKALFLEAFKENKTVLFLVPEVTLALQFEQIFKRTLSSRIPVHGFHSASSRQDKKSVWSCAQTQTAQLIIGVHLPVLLPLPNLGLIIVDEEHENGFQEKKHPRINSKEAALMRAQLYGVPIVLGSATPSIASLYNVTHRNWKLFTITKRFKGAFPAVKLVSLLDRKERKHFWISTELRNALAFQLQKKEQSIIFINRRGVSFFVQCSSCGYVSTCTNCSVSLTLHENDLLRCHYCNLTQAHPTTCPQCTKQEFLKKGIGTQQITQILQKMFPTARIGRADLDATVNRKSWSKTISDFENKAIDILVGTQTITKGYDFPGVTLVGIIWADIDLNFPFYNAHETALQKVIQVAGRAGRHTTTSSVIIQTMGKHDIFDFATETRYRDFYNQEIENRTELLYPPVGRFAEISIKHKDETIVDNESSLIFDKLSSYSHLTLLGPSAPPIAKIKNVFAKKIFIKSTSFSAIITAYQAINHALYKSTIHFTPSPLS